LYATFSVCGVDEEVTVGEGEGAEEDEGEGAGEDCCSALKERLEEPELISAALLCSGSLASSLRRRPSGHPVLSCLVLSCLVLSGSGDGKWQSK
jgi:hypothetical protein